MSQTPGTRNAAALITLIQPQNGLSALNFGELWRYRDLLVTLARRDIAVRYRQTAIGVLWVVLQPLIAAAIFAFVFGSIARVSSDGKPAFLYSFTAMIAWTAFQATISKANVSLVSNANLVSKVYFPRLVLPLSTVLGNLLDFGISLVMLLVMLLLFRVTPTPALLLLPVWLFFLLLLALGAGLYAATGTVWYRDIQFVVPIVLNFLLYATPIGWGATELAKHIPAALQPVYFLLNPLASLIEAFRWSVLGTPFPPVGYLVYACVLGVVLFLTGAVAFRNMERRFADVI